MQLDHYKYLVSENKCTDREQNTNNSSKAACAPRHNICNLVGTISVTIEGINTVLNTGAAARAQAKRLADILVLPATDAGFFVVDQPKFAAAGNASFLVLAGRILATVVDAPSRLAIGARVQTVKGAFHSVDRSPIRIKRHCFVRALRSPSGSRGMVEQSQGKDGQVYAHFVAASVVW
jgi:hypothetical protein